MSAPTPDTVLRAAEPGTRPIDRTRRQTEVVAALSGVLPPHALLWHREDTIPYECDGLTAYREQPLVVALPENEAQVAATLDACPPSRRAGGGARCRHRTLGRRLAERARRDAQPGQVQPHRRHRCEGPHGHGAVRRAQPRHQRGSGFVRPLLRARSEQPDRLHDRRQRLREFRWRALPQVRPDAAQRAEAARLHRRRDRYRTRQRRARCRGARPAGRGDRQRRHARRRHRGHGQAAAEAGDGALHPGELRRRREGGQRGRRHHRRRHRPRWPGDDGRADDGRRRGASSMPATTSTRPPSCSARATARRPRSSTRSRA